MDFPLRRCAKMRSLCDSVFAIIKRLSVSRGVEDLNLRRLSPQQVSNLPQ